ncbi:MAG TPA: hypothetical protein VHC97_17340 [Thermoanaerobaculia bacterium]|nr:hypothetical protein [Thermoanaerobaculia bacterium]
MKDDEIEDASEDLFPDDPDDFLDRLDSGLEELGLLNEAPVTTPLSPQEIDDVIERALAGELARLSGLGPKT